MDFGSQIHAVMRQRQNTYNSINKIGDVLTRHIEKQTRKTAEQAALDFFKDGISLEKVKEFSLRYNVPIQNSLAMGAGVAKQSRAKKVGDYAGMFAKWATVERANGKEIGPQKIANKMIEFNVPQDMIPEVNQIAQQYIQENQFEIKSFGEKVRARKFNKQTGEVSKIEGLPDPTPKEKTPTTAMGAFLTQNKNASPDEIAAFAQKLKGKGIKVTNADGSMIEIGGAKTGLSTGTSTSLQKDVVGLAERLNDMDALGKDVFKEALTLQGNVKGKALRLADWAKINIGKDNKEFLGKTRAFIEGIEQTFNQYRKEITGAQAAMKEISMLRTSILNKKLTPTEFEYSYNRYVNQMKWSLRLKRMLLRTGVSTEALGKQIDSMFITGKDVPKSEIDARGDELSAQGLSDDMVVEQLKKEGYVGK